MRQKIGDRDACADATCQTVPVLHAVVVIGFPIGLVPGTGLTCCRRLHDNTGRRPADKSKDTQKQQKTADHLTHDVDK